MTSMSGFLCECDSLACGLTVILSEQDFESYPGLFTESDTQFIAVGCKIGPDPAMDLMYETETYQVYRDQ